MLVPVPMTRSQEWVALFSFNLQWNDDGSGRAVDIGLMVAVAVKLTVA